MATFLEAAQLILASAAAPLSAREITDRAIQRGLLEPAGRTPWHTLEAALSLHILHNRDHSPFMRTTKGRFVLRAFKLQYDEYVAERRPKTLFDEDIAVVPEASFKDFVPAPGFHSENIDTQRLLTECRPLLRREAETRYDVIQLVSFYIVTYDGQYLTHKRTKRLPESRLHGYYSLGFGGHLNIEDIPILMNISDPDLALLQITRELEEELVLSTPPKIVFRGLLYDDSRDVSKQHVGLVYDVGLVSKDFTIGERGFLTDAKFEHIDQILKRLDDFENWSVTMAQLEASRNAVAK